jgi:hypothetical protein
MLEASWTRSRSRSTLSTRETNAALWCAAPPAVHQPVISGLRGLFQNGFADTDCYGLCRAQRLRTVQHPRERRTRTELRAVDHTSYWTARASFCRRSCRGSEYVPSCRRLRCSPSALTRVERRGDAERSRGAVQDARRRMERDGYAPGKPADHSLKGRGPSLPECAVNNQ